MAHPVKCKYCGQTFDRDKVEHVQVSKARYAHIECHKDQQLSISQEERDLEELRDYIKKLFNTDYINAKINTQIKEYHEKYNYSYIGMKKTLFYFYEVKQNSMEKANGGIGIIPHVYHNAYEYYANIDKANVRNDKIDIENIQKEEDQIIFIKPPQRLDKRKKLFAFFEEGTT